MFFCFLIIVINHISVCSSSHASKCSSKSFTDDREADDETKQTETKQKVE